VRIKDIKEKMMWILGNTGSILQLGTCSSPPSKYQLWTLTESGTLQQKGESGLCMGVPPRAASDHMDLH
jgi:hypothetical protein